MSEEGVISNLQSELESLRERVKELEAENAKLSSTISRCHCSKREEKKLMVDESRKMISKVNRKSTERLPGSTDHYFRRFIALKVMYFGKGFYGFASEAQMDPTVESEIFKALEKTRLLVGDKKESQYSRCGRTDKGVSSVGQVISLFVRSRIKEIREEEEHNDGEFDYVRVLNRVLPEDIRIVGWCPVPVGFSARFSCLSRKYKYLFWSKDMNLLAVEDAGKRLVGEHDFRNFCKMDAVNVHNYRRRITSFQISSCDMKFLGNELSAIEINGSAFLWHQVRCIVAVLFMIGQGLESPDIIDTLLDIDGTARKPQYAMAPEIPLILLSCEFEGLNFICSSNARQALCEHLQNECRTYQLQAAIFHEALLGCLPSENNQSSLCNGVAKKASHVPLMSRPTEPSYEERRIKINSKT
ncbi:tRNA pseudouridine(38/39) synthase isoform X2 [Tripterygium wilfordii]|uniref:tRNA pseudouridine(38/39) synthase isoform X2 n=1 Tax=Tripterygium wilfordii TaxID=458696 RepID=A0A7J7DXB1_TRIWF|nr:tRNA pseudouridine(38/39) synthase [Tripterygium wilfordii]KAF5750736.1 tRNA pseudouridine(38/39) synthase isoform X2 [Tripterygium wilfordii]